jgi:hypothetical protein
MANLRKYDMAFDKEDLGLGLGGNPQDMTLQTDRLNESKDESGVTINPPQPPQPRALNKTDFIKMMNQ